MLSSADRTIPDNTTLTQHFTNANVKDAEDAQITTSGESSSESAGVRNQSQREGVSIRGSLPAFAAITSSAFLWGSFDADVISQEVGRIYEKVVHWRRNLFPLPKGAAGKELVKETTRLFNGFSRGSPLEGVAWPS